jgi:amino acid transporter
MKTLIKNLHYKLIEWDIDPTTLAKAIGIFLVVVMVIVIMAIYPILLIILLITLLCIALIGLIYTMIE